LAYGKRTGVTSFKQTIKEVCELLRKFQPTIVAWINASTLDATDKALAITAISAVNAACAAIQALPDD